MPKEASEDYAKLMPDPPLHCIDAEETRLKLPHLPEGCASVQHKGSPVYMDMNNHLNNTAYLTWILDSIPDDVLNNKVLSQYEVEYKAEGVAGMHLSEFSCALGFHCVRVHASEGRDMLPSCSTCHQR